MQDPNMIAMKQQDLAGYEVQFNSMVAKRIVELTQQLVQAEGGQQQDPLIQMQQPELQIKQQEVQIKAPTTMADIQLDQEKLMLEKAKLDSQERLEGAKIGMKIGADKQRTEMDNQKFQAEQQARGVELGLDVAKSELDRQDTKELAMMNMKEQTQPKE